MSAPMKDLNEADLAKLAETFAPLSACFDRLEESFARVAPAMRKLRDDAARLAADFSEFVDRATAEELGMPIEEWKSLSAEEQLVKKTELLSQLGEVSR